MPNAWMIRAGEGGRLIEEFAKGYVGVGWNALGDMTKISGQEEIRALYLKNYPDERPGAVGNQITMFYKFRSVVQQGDKVITYDPSQREYLVGTIAGDYQYSPETVGDYPHVRQVNWEGRISRDDLTVSSRNSLGSTLTLFSINEDVWADMQKVLAGLKTLPKEEQLEEEKNELEVLRKDVISTAHEFIKDRILALNADEMEALVASILRGMGYRTRISPKGSDRGLDIMASPDGLGLEEPRIKVEVKHRSKQSIGSQDIRSFLGGLREGNRALYVSTGGFTKEAKYEADRSNIPLTLVDLDEVASLVVMHYENFDLEGRALIPLTRVYWPVD